MQAFIALLADMLGVPQSSVSCTNCNSNNRRAEASLRFQVAATNAEQSVDAAVAVISNDPSVFKSADASMPVVMSARSSQVDEDVNGAAAGGGDTAAPAPAPIPLVAIIVPVCVVVAAAAIIGGVLLYRRRSRVVAPEAMSQNQFFRERTNTLSVE